jgi:hypothetical protein
MAVPQVAHQTATLTACRMGIHGNTFRNMVSNPANCALHNCANPCLCKDLADA